LGAIESLLGDVVVPAPGRDQVEDTRSRPVSSANGVAAGGALNKPSIRRATRPEDGLARGHGLDSPHDLVLLGTLEQVTASARAHRPEHRVVIVEHGQHEHGDARCRPADLSGRLHPVQVRHLQIQHDDVGVQADGRLDRLPPGRREADDLDRGHRRQQRGQPAAHDRVVVGQHHGDRVGDRVGGAHGAPDPEPAGHSGSSARTRPPPPGPGPAEPEPPSSAARSRMDTRPTPGIHGSLPRRPSSTTSTLNRQSATTPSRTSARCAPPCLAALVTASVTIR
jgi:hypothetical protein